MAPPKKIHRPRTKHAEFAETSFRLLGDDWILCIWCQANKQACYFLAEPDYGSGPDAKKIIGYFVSALERAGESASALPGLPRRFKTTDAAADWLSTRLMDYAGDVFVGRDIPVGEKVATHVETKVATHVDTKVSTSLGRKIKREQEKFAKTMREAEQ